MKPSSYWIKGAQSYPRIVADNESMIDDHSGDLEEDREEIVLYQEEFLVPATPSEASLSDRDELQDGTCVKNNNNNNNISIITFFYFEQHCLLHCGCLIIAIDI